MPGMPIFRATRSLLSPYTPGTDAFAERVNKEIAKIPGDIKSLLNTPAEKNPILGGFLGVISPGIAAKTKFPVRLPTSKAEFMDAVRNTPGAEITADGLRLNAIRYQKPEQAGMESVRGGVMYLLDPKDKYLKYYRGGKQGYGGADKISGDTVVRNPLVVKGATGGNAQKAAYDTLNGKGAYGSMREDALKSVSVWGGAETQKLQKVEDFLSKYAPERVNMAQYIIESSRHGNTLPYALQEMAVHNSASKAGYDSVLGYSKKRDGSHYLSELFDLREQTYPDVATKEGDIYQGLLRMGDK